MEQKKPNETTIYNRSNQIVTAIPSPIAFAYQIEGGSKLIWNQKMGYITVQKDNGFGVGIKSKVYYYKQFLVTIPKPLADLAGIRVGDVVAWMIIEGVLSLVQKK